MRSSPGPTPSWWVRHLTAELSLSCSFIPYFRRIVTPFGELAMTGALPDRTFYPG
jgi:hypothetical protein